MRHYNVAEGTDDQGSIVKRFFIFHPITGRLRKGPVHMMDRAAQLGLSLLLNLLLVGLFMIGEETVDEPRDEVDADEYLPYGIYSAIISFFLIILIDITMYSPENNYKFKRTLRWTLIIVLCLLSITGISIFTSVFCENWSKIWCLVFLFAVFIEWFILHSIYALIRVCVSMKRSQPRMENFV